MAAERLWNSNYCKVMVANFALFFAFYVLTPLLPLYLSEHFGATYGTGILLGGIIAEHLGYSAAFWTVALVNAMGVALYFLATKSFFLHRNLNDSVR